MKLTNMILINCPSFCTDRRIVRPYATDLSHPGVVNPRERSIMRVQGDDRLDVGSSYTRDYSVVC